MSKKALLALVTPAAIAIGALGAAPPAAAAPGDPVPSCVLTSVTNTAATTTVLVRNGCASPQRVLVRIDNVTSGCTILPVGAVRRWTVTPPATSVRIVQC
jgi:hypothetical protein